MEEHVVVDFLLFTLFLKRQAISKVSTQSIEWADGRIAAVLLTDRILQAI